MSKHKINPLVLIAVMFSSLSLAMYAYRSYVNEEIGYAVLFTLLSLAFIGAVLWGLANNFKSGQKK